MTEEEARQYEMGLRQYATTYYQEDELEAPPAVEGGDYAMVDTCAGAEDAAACTEQEACTLADGTAGQNMYVEYALGDSDPQRISEPICSPAAQLPEGDEPVALPVFTVEDLQRLEIAAAASSVEPAPDTLVGLHTNVYATATNQVFDTELAGFPVQVRVFPESYTWDYGDGTTLGPTQIAGDPLPEGSWDVATDTSHTYEQTGDVQVVLTTTYVGEYSIGGGPWLPVAGTSTVTSDPVQLSVWRSTVRNYADDCRENPSGAGC